MSPLKIISALYNRASAPSIYLAEYTLNEENDQWWLQNHKEHILNTCSFIINVLQRIVQQIMACRLDTRRGFYAQNLTHCTSNDLVIQTVLSIIRSEDETLRQKRTLPWRPESGPLFYSHLQVAHLSTLSVTLIPYQWRTGKQSIGIYVRWRGSGLI
jgi:hypothetical protein